MPTEPRRHLHFARSMIGLFIAGLVLSGLTAMPVQTQLDWGVRFFDRSGGVGGWLWRVRDAVEQINRDAPFIFYGYDWLAFGHIAIAIAVVQAYRDPVKHRWLLDYGLLLCGLVVVWAVSVAPFRGIPWGWVAFDCSFGLIGAIPLLLARRAVTSRPVSEDAAKKAARLLTERH
jgi:hypothetical protein